MNSVETARAFLDQNFPNCDAAILAGSSSRNEETTTSDLDIVVIDEKALYPYEETLQAFGRTIDVIFNSHETCRKFFKSDMKNHRPVITHMCAKGLILKDTDGLAQQIQHEANQVFEYGPDPLQQDAMDRWRHDLTNLADDFSSSRSREESFVFASYLATGATDALLAAQRRWTGSGKWQLRALYDYDPQVAQQWIDAVEAFYQRNSRRELVTYAQLAITALGGPLIEYVRGRKDQTPDPSEEEYEEEEEQKENVLQ
ncbi:nucleotidyltransferase domain-containing protein [Dictyobacter arantiisoli]|uniref:Nucleotidyltransferase n=1 Tax=Dictyobacter arantiisoli TaxID=2014874 RepID=A0A5A5T9W2_9CHLR|nr:nucleotidyltransferase domain-containing protein [Dictyobacter arantiisoli]GCF07694.1 nucleotidyltransferase [Dictyobacter arantiisoli]